MEDAEGGTDGLDEGKWTEWSMSEGKGGVSEGRWTGVEEAVFGHS